MWVCCYASGNLDSSLGTQMTHDELLALIDSNKHGAVEALRAVVELEEHIFIGNFVDLHGKNEIYQLGIKDYKESVRNAIEKELK